MMRADRLISILMLLQTHEKMTADELSRELEVSRRTIYRDITALNMAGVPIYTDRGPSGGIALLESYRTTLTGLSEDEVRALSMLSIPEPLAKLGLGSTLKSAFLKLAAALSASQQGVGLSTQQRIYLDTAPWTPTEETLPAINTIQKAIWGEKWIYIKYLGSFDSQLEIDIFPLGLVSKGDTWYLVGKAGDHIRVIKVRDILEAKLSDQDSMRDKSFDLVRFWQKWCREYNARRPVYWTKLNLAPEVVKKLAVYFGEDVKAQIIDTSEPYNSGWITVKVGFEHFFKARASILNLGCAVEVLEPEALKVSVIDFAEQISQFYKHTPD